MLIEISGRIGMAVRRQIVLSFRRATLNIVRMDHPGQPHQRRRTLAALLAALIAPRAMAQAGGWRVGQSVSLPALALFDGSSVDWKSLHGQVIVLEFWASWCPFCARQNPLLDRFYRQHQARGLEVITISVDKTKEAAVAYMKKNGYAFKAGMATPAWQAIYQQRQGLPQLFAIDRSGRLAAIEVREMMEEDIRDLARLL